MRINYEKHFVEDAQFKPDYEVPYKTLRYIRKLAMRDNLATLTPQTFLEDEQYKEMQIWDLKYISTSDEEDNDSSEEESSSSDEDEEKKEEKAAAKTLEEVKVQIEESKAMIEEAGRKRVGEEEFNEGVLE